MASYKEKYAIGSRVKIASTEALSKFRSAWKYHHKLTSSQLRYAGQLAEVEFVTYYHGGDVLYELRGVPGIWHEECLQQLASEIN